uniref:Calponin-homology (CH) domain-containing protein n=1 Tax=Leptobrachium leishanense TaxID=445787 RepID=A0A8C5Q381_9ANUR
MVEEQHHLSTIKDIEDHDAGLQPKENEEKLKEEPAGQKVVPIQGDMHTKDEESDSLLHKEMGVAKVDKSDLKAETPSEEAKRLDAAHIAESLTDSTEKIPTGAETSTNIKAAPDLDAATNPKSSVTKMEKDQLCKDKELEDNDEETERKDEETESKSDETENKDEGTESKQEEPPSGAEQTSEELGSESPSKETDSAVKDKIPAVPSPSKEPSKGKERPERKLDLPRTRTVPKSCGRATKKEIAEKFGGVATSGIRVQRSTSCGAGAVKNMLMEWCRAKTRNYQGVEIQNFSSSWSSGLAFCALIHAFFPDAFDYESLDPKNRRENFQLAFNTAEKHADCPPLLDVEDMIHMKVPDSKCIYTYVQELYRSLVSKGLVKTKKA